MKIKLDSFNALDIIKCQVHEIDYGYIIPAYPAVGNLFVNKVNLSYITGYIRTRGKDHGRYPYNYLQMLDNVFGYEKNTIETCSHSVSGRDIFTVDINPKYNPTVVDDAQVLDKIPDRSFDRYRADPPYNENTARTMYNCELPNIRKLLSAASRICKDRALIFLLLGPVNRQPHYVSGLKKIGHVALSVIPNSEMRCLHIYYKVPNEMALDYRLPEVKLPVPNYDEDDTCEDSTILDTNKEFLQVAGYPDSQVAGGD